MFKLSLYIGQFHFNLFFEKIKGMETDSEKMDKKLLKTFVVNVRIVGKAYLLEGGNIGFTQRQHSKRWLRTRRPYDT